MLRQMFSRIFVMGIFLGFLLLAYNVASPRYVKAQCDGCNSACGFISCGGCCKNQQCICDPEIGECRLLSNCPPLSKN